MTIWPGRLFTYAILPQIETPSTYCTLKVLNRETNGYYFTRRPEFTVWYCNAGGVVIHCCPEKSGKGEGYGLTVPACFDQNQR